MACCWAQVNADAVHQVNVCVSYGSYVLMSSVMAWGHKVKAEHPAAKYTVLHGGVLKIKGYAQQPNNSNNHFKDRHYFSCIWTITIFAKEHLQSSKDPSLETSSSWETQCSKKSIGLILSLQNSASTSYRHSAAAHHLYHSPAWNNVTLLVLGGPGLQM